MDRLSRGILLIRIVVFWGIFLALAGAYWKSRMPRKRPPLIEPPRAGLSDYEQASLVNAIKFNAKAPDADVAIVQSWPPKTIFVKAMGQLSTRVIYRIRKRGQDDERRDALYTIGGSSPGQISDVAESAESHRANDAQFPCAACPYADALRPAGENAATPPPGDDRSTP